MSKIHNSKFTSVGEWMEFYETLFKEDNPVSTAPLSLDERKTDFDEEEID